MMVAMDALRKLPLFVRIGLMWWVVLLAYPLSRPFLLYRIAGAHGLIGLPTMALGLVSLTHALAASWLGVRLLQWRGCGRTAGSLIVWSAAMAWFAVSTWGCVIAIARLFEPGDSSAQSLDRFAGIVHSSIVLLPWVAWTSFWKATWILLPLALASVLMVRQQHRGVPAAQAAGSTAD